MYLAADYENLCAEKKSSQRFFLRFLRCVLCSSPTVHMDSDIYSTTVSTWTRIFTAQL
jgi:hypothetical protein